MWSLVKEWCRVTTMHGPQDALNSRNHCSRCLWILLILFSCLVLVRFAQLGKPVPSKGASLGMSKVLNVMHLVAAFRAETNWTTTIVERRMESVPYPYLTLCNYNRISKKKADALNLTMPLVSFLYYTMGDPDRYSLKVDMTNIGDFAEWRRNAGFTDMREMWDALAPSCEETFSRIGLKNRRTIGGNELCAKGHVNFGGNSRSPNRTLVSLVKALSNDLGRCHQLKVHVNMSGPGEGQGLSLILDTNYQDAYPSSQNNYLEEGFAFQLTSTPAITEGSWASLNPGRSIRLAMSPRQRRLRDAEFYENSYLSLTPPCLHQSQLRLETMPSEHYTRKVCEEDCRRQDMLEKCGCLPLHKPYKNFKVCTPEMAFNCAVQSEEDNFMEMSVPVNMKTLCNASHCGNASRVADAAFGPAPGLVEEKATVDGPPQLPPEEDERKAPSRNDRLKNCSESCGDPCQELFHTYTTSEARFPSKASVRQLTDYQLFGELYRYYLEHQNASDLPFNISDVRLDDQWQLSLEGKKAAAKLVTGQKLGDLKKKVELGFVSLNVYMDSMTATVVELHQRMTVTSFSPVFQTFQTGSKSITRFQNRAQPCLVLQ